MLRKLYITINKVFNAIISIIKTPYFGFIQGRHIVPSRIAWSQENGELIRKKFSSKVNVSWIWFLKPIVATSEPLINYNYKEGDCPISEYVCEGMLNLPTSIPLSSFVKMINMISPILNDTKKSDNSL